MPTAHLLETRNHTLTEIRPLASRSSALGENSTNHFEPLLSGGREPLFMMGNNAAPFVTDSSMGPSDVAREAFLRGPQGDA